MIALVDYGAGNLTSVRKGFAAAGAELFTPLTSDDLASASAIVVPGVGNFGSTAGLQGGWRSAIERAVSRDVPLLGICLGMQWLFEGSDEAPGLPGLGMFAGSCVRLRGDGPLKVPHVGWNSLARIQHSRLLDGIADEAFVYFTHAYAAPVTSATVAAGEHGERFAAVIEHGLTFGVQFHPEKSGQAGLRILRNFVEIAHAG